MKRTTALLAALGLLLVPAMARAVEDKKDATGCSDLPSFNRMPGYWIHSCQAKDFDAHDFLVGPRVKTTRVEGKVASVFYIPQASLKPTPSELQILRNHENAVKRLGGKAVFVDRGRETLVYVQGGREIWVDVSAEFTGKYRVLVLEKGAMEQDIVATADALLDGLCSTGHVSVGGIFFDTGKAELKAESQPALVEIGKLMAAHPALALFVVGHTDTVGSPESNLALSQARAEAVLQALVKQHGVAAARLRPFGAGPFAPVASNDAEEGRALNRRVELVKQ